MESIQSPAHTKYILYDKLATRTTSANCKQEISRTDRTHHPSLFQTAPPKFRRSPTSGSRGRTPALNAPKRARNESTSLCPEKKGGPSSYQHSVCTSAVCGGANNKIRQQQRSRFLDFGPQPSPHLRLRPSFGPRGRFFPSGSGRTRRSRHAPRSKSCQPGECNPIDTSANRAMRFIVCSVREFLMRFRRAPG